MAHVFAKTFTSSRQDNASHVTYQVLAGHANRKLNVHNATCTKGTKKNQSIQRVFAEDNFPLSTTLALNATLKDVKGVSKSMFVCLVQKKMGMKLMWDLMESVSKRIRTQSFLFGRLLEVSWSFFF